MGGAAAVSRGIPSMPAWAGAKVERLAARANKAMWRSVVRWDVECCDMAFLLVLAWTGFLQLEDSR
jgi:hypothetical protein